MKHTQNIKKGMLSLFLLFTVSFLFAENPEDFSLEQVCEKLSAHKNTTGDFIQTKILQTNGRKLKSTGKYIICPEGILWKTEKPVSSSLILTKEMMIQISANGNKSVMSGKDNQTFLNISETLSSVFSGDVAALKNNFNCSFSKEQNGEWTVELSPKDSTIASVMKMLVLSGISQNETEMTSLIMTEASGNTITYEFTNQKYPKELSADEKQNFIIE